MLGKQSFVKAVKGTIDAPVYNSESTHHVSTPISDNHSRPIRGKKEVDLDKQSERMWRMRETETDRIRDENFEILLKKHRPQLWNLLVGDVRA